MLKLRSNFSSLKAPRLFGWLVFTVFLLAVIGLLHPQQFWVSVYKLSLVTLAGVAGYWLDRALFPYARPHSFIEDDPDTDPPRAECVMGPGCEAITVGAAESMQQSFAASMIRRAIIVGCAMLAVGLGA